MRCGENRNPALGHGVWCASGVLAPALSEGALGATAAPMSPPDIRTLKGKYGTAYPALRGLTAEIMAKCEERTL